jgi:O-antigen ligase
MKVAAGVLSIVAPLARPGRAGTVSFAVLLTGSLIGAALAVNIPFGIALLVGACYTPLVFLNFSLAVCLWIPLVFLEGIPAFNLGGKAAGLLLAVGWMAMLHSDRVATSVLRRHRRLVEALVGLLLWVTLSLAWAPDLGRAWGNVWQWWAVAVLFLIVATAVRSGATLRMVVAAFVAGAVASILPGLLSGDIAAGTGAAAGRFEGGAGDPNFLASGLVPAIVLAAGLAAARGSALWRSLMVVVIGLLAVGLVMTQSRGAAVAAVITVVAALLFFRGRRFYVVALTLIATGFIVVAFTFVPGAWERISGLDRTGPGPRGELWTVAWRVAEDHPIVGVGTNNFAAVSRDYVREPGTLTHLQVIAEDPKVVHNLYLQLYTENGIPGLVLFLLVVAGCLRAAWLAGRRFEALGRRDLEAIAQSILVAQIAILSAAVFLSSQVDKRLWILLAFGPAALEVSRRITSPQTPRLTP